MDTAPFLELVIGTVAGLAHNAGMSESHYRSCRCGAIYNRTEAMASARQIASFECTICNTTMESWNTAWVPTYRLIAGPVRKTDPDS